MKQLAIIGSGISGLGCLYFLHEHYQITLYEKNDYIGGHTNTVDVEENGKKLPVDTGFMVFNKVTYPNLLQLFDTLAIPYKPTDMSFSVRHEALNLEWNGAGLNKLFGQRKNLFNLRFWRMLKQMERFNREAVENLENPRYKTLSVAELVAERGYGQDFLELFMIPMSSAIWSTPPHKMIHFPARTLIRFFFNHGFLGLDTHHQWYTVEAGARTYVHRLLSLCAPELQLNRTVVGVETQASGQVKVTAQTPQGARESREFDRVIMASHADQSLAMLTQPTPLQKAILSPFQYQKNQATLHTDSTLLPKTQRCRASWNYQIRPAQGGDQTSESVIYDAATHYWMNSLQGVSEHQDYLVTINGEDWIQPDQIRNKIAYEHPIFDEAAIAAQDQLPQLNQEGQQTGIYFCGSYFRFGFHEDAFTSAVDLSTFLLGALSWKR
ncbi:NAD(P)/FAD-dependent oxidoreductase [Vampirovibrio sp.]|uniref:NAD(P)/FAD-dependent oxidoreductase n=1 Tax=Vampirovibrio sp. TaxID=2717857 RepID=UPI0035946F80